MASTYIKLDVKGITEIDHILWKLFGYISYRMKKEKNQHVHVTSIMEGIHKDGSMHPLGKAIDFERNGFTKEWVRERINEFCEKRGYKSSDFDLLSYDDKDIFHLERDVKQS